MPDDNNYSVVYGFGYAKYLHTSDEIEQELEVFIPNEEAIKIGILKLNNKSLTRKKLRIVYYLKPVLDEDEIKSNSCICTKERRYRFFKSYKIRRISRLYWKRFSRENT